MLFDFLAALLIAVALFLGIRATVEARSNTNKIKHLFKLWHDEQTELELFNDPELSDEKMSDMQIDSIRYKNGDPA